MTAKIQFSAAKYQELQEQLAQLGQTEREVLDRLVTAREMGDLSENGAYKYAKFELGNVRRQIRELKRLLAVGEPMQPYQSTGVVTQGSSVTLESNGIAKTFTVVNEYEADIQHNRISYKSPIGKAIMGKQAGDVVHVVLPNGTVVYTVTDVT